MVSLILGPLLAASANAAWTQVGQSMTHATVVAAAIDFDDLTGSPLLAYGYADNSTGGTTISFNEWNSTAQAWEQIAHHVSQFPQQYDNFLFRARGGLLYLGLDIGQDEDLASVLRGEGGFDGFDGAYAWQGSVFDYEINASGDMRLIMTPDNSTLQLVTYNHTGWDSYPASDTYGPVTTVVPSSPTSSIDDVVVCRAPNDTLYAAFVDAGVISVFRSTLSNTSAHVPVAGGDTVIGDHVGIAFAAGFLCVSAIAPNRSLSVSCATDSSNAWTGMGLGDPPVDPGLASAIAISNNGTVFVAALSSNASYVVSVFSCEIDNAGGVLSCPAGWDTDEYAAAGVVTNFDLKGTASSGLLEDSIFLSVSETVASVDTLAVLQAT